MLILFYFNPYLIVFAGKPGIPLNLPFYFVFCHNQRSTANDSDVLITIVNVNVAIPFAVIF